MANKSNYYSILKKTERCFHCGSGGWEIRIYTENDGKQYVCIPKGLPKEARKDLRLQMKIEGILARAVNSEKQYRDLCARIGREDWDYILKNNLKGQELIQWAYNTPTSQEYYNLLRYN